MAPKRLAVWTRRGARPRRGCGPPEPAALEHSTSTCSPSAPPSRWKKGKPLSETAQGRVNTFAGWDPLNFGFGVLGSDVHKVFDGLPDRWLRVADGRNEGDTPGRNDKGLATYDRQTRKDVFYWYKANWSTDPFVYISSRRFTSRTQAATTIKIYSNTDSVQLMLNGVSQGSNTSTNHIYSWNVTLAVTGFTSVVETQAQP